MTTEQLVTHNGWVGQKDDAREDHLYALADDVGAPLVIAAQELKLYRGSFPGYERVAADPTAHPSGLDAASSVLFVRRRGVTIVKHRIVSVGGPDWKGPKHDKMHKPRVFPGATLDLASGERVDVLCVHRNPGGPDSRNPGAWAAEDAAIVEFVAERLERHPDRAIVILGDWNNGINDTSDLSVSDLAKRIRKLAGRNVPVELHIPNGKPAIDGALLINCRGKAKKLNGLYGSDGHHPVVITITF